MLVIKLDVKSRWQAQIPAPRKYPRLVEMARTFVARDETLPIAEQSPYLDEVRALLVEMSMLTEQRATGETERTISAETLKRAEQEAQMVARQVQGLIVALYPLTPERAEEWGLNLKQGTGAINLPRTRTERLAFLNRYLAKEESRPPTERFQVPNLDNVRQIRDTITASLVTRSSGVTRREGSIAGIITLAYRLQQRLQAAAVYLVSKRFGYQLTPELQAWGFEVVERQRSRGEKGKEGEAASSGEGIEAMTG